MGCGAAASHPCGVTVMANQVWSGDSGTLYLLDANLDPIATEEHSWSGLKAMYR